MGIKNSYTFSNLLCSIYYMKNDFLTNHNSLKSQIIPNNPWYKTSCIRNRKTIQRLSVKMHNSFFLLFQNEMKYFKMQKPYGKWQVLGGEGETEWKQGAGRMEEGCEWEILERTGKMEVGCCVWRRNLPSACVPPSVDHSGLSFAGGHQRKMCWGFHGRLSTAPRRVA